VREIRTPRVMRRALETEATAIPKRARRGKPRIQAKEKPTSHRASARPYRGCFNPVCTFAGGWLARWNLECHLMQALTAPVRQISRHFAGRDSSRYCPANVLSSRLRPHAESHVAR